MKDNQRKQANNENSMETILAEKQVKWLREIDEENLSLKLQIELAKIQLQILKRE